MTLTDFLLARIAEDEELADRVEFRPYVGEGLPQSLQARVLAECEAKRRIVESCDGFDEQGLEVRQLLTMPYADHPDYREEWKP